MAQATLNRHKIDAPFFEFLKNERAKSLSAREWKFRLAGYGYAIKDIEGGQVVTTLPGGAELGTLPSQIA